MKLGYLRDDPKIGLKEQAKMVAGYGVAERDIHRDARRKDADGFPNRDWLIDLKVRPSGKDEIVVAYFFLLDTQHKRLPAVVGRAQARKAVIVEAATGRRSDKSSDLIEMYEDARTRYAGHWLSPDEARAMSDKSSSPVGKVKTGRMPWAKAVKIIDAAQSVDIGIAQVNADRRYKTRYNRPYIYAMNRDDKNKVKLKPRISGRVQRELLGLPPTPKRK